VQNCSRASAAKVLTALVRRREREKGFRKGDDRVKRGLGLAVGGCIFYGALCRRKQLTGRKGKAILRIKKKKGGEGGKIDILREKVIVNVMGSLESKTD